MNIINLRIQTSFWKQQVNPQLTSLSFNIKQLTLLLAAKMYETADILGGNLAGCTGN